ncbi:hypothetical protein CAPTEDRAFT_202447 [Capitella teleta]|uniref:Aminotransferase class I/classII large domain-containing protein n=1 Tax=Capitella teleta TaxID=283909 RepID=R7TJK7_CAPTE|nr:hypothetical protein CAPTEDRAFT_202447 [Capitella teleta]|eukprot:ELT91726.1 hypothetical protein CAPTEDRAFT_202447 [Capitella teleta]
MSVCDFLPQDPLSGFFERHSTHAKYWLSCSEMQPLKQRDVLAMADSQCRDMWDDLELGYTEAAGHPLLRQEIAKLHNVNADDILVDVPHEAIYVAVNSLVPYLTRRTGRRRIHCVTCLPGYPALSIIADKLGCEMGHWKARNTRDGWTFHLNDLKSVVKDNTQLIIVNFPHNPTGFCPTATEFTQLVKFCKARDIFLFSDEMYLLTDFASSEPMPSACSMYDNSVSLFGMSKTLAQPGVRLGWLVTRNKEVWHEMNKCKDYFSQCCSATSEILSIITLRNMDTVLNQVKGLIAKNLDLLDNFFAEYTDVFEWHRPKAATVTLVEVKGWLLEEYVEGGTTALCDDLYTEESIVILPGGIFDEMDSNTIRLGFGKSDLDDSLKALRRFLEHHRPSVSH